MVATRHPLIDLVYNDETGRYIGMLERKLLKLQLDDLKFRALLELLTGDSWDDYSFSAEDEAIQTLAQDALKRRLGLSDEDARSLVQERWAAHNPPDPDPTANTYMIRKPTETPHIVSQARPMAPPMPYDVRKHLEGLETAKKNRDAYRDQL